MSKRTAVTKSGVIQDSIIQVLAANGDPLDVRTITMLVAHKLGEPVSPSSVRSSLRLQSKKNSSVIKRVARGLYTCSDTEFISAPHTSTPDETFTYKKTMLIHDDAFSFMSGMNPKSIHAIVTDPPYGLVEYDNDSVDKLREGHGGVWRIPPSFDGHRRSPLPRFTTLTEKDLDRLSRFFLAFGHQCMRTLVPGGNVLVASNPLVCHVVTTALAKAGLEPRGQVIRLVQTMRGGDRPKGHEKEFRGVSVMPRSQWEPWICMRKPLDGTVAYNLKTWRTGGWKRISEDRPFGDVIQSAPTRSNEKKIANHPSLKPQAFMRQVVVAALPLGEGTILDPFAGSGSTLAAANWADYDSIGIEHDEKYFQLACNAIPKLEKIEV